MAEEVLRATIKRLESEEKAQEKKLQLKHAYAERARIKSDSKRIMRTEAEEEQAMAVLQQIRVEKNRAETGLLILRYVDRHQPVASATVAEAFNVSVDTLEEHIKALGLVTDNDGNVFRDSERMREITVTRQFEAWEQERKGIIGRLRVIAEHYPGLTRDELTAIYKKQYPDDDGLERYLKECQFSIEMSPTRESRAGTWILIISLILLIAVIVLTIVALFNPSILEEAWSELYLNFVSP